MGDAGVRCAVACALSADDLRIELRLDSHATEPVLVSVECTYPTTHAQWLPAATRTPRGLAAPRPWTFFSPPDGLLLWFGRVALPPGVEVYAPFLPLYARLDPGASLVVPRALPLPIDELDPYFDPPSSAQTTADTARRLVVVCDWIPVAATAWINRGPRGLVFCSGPSFARLNVEVPLDSRIAIARRTDAFHRQALEPSA